MGNFDAQRNQTIPINAETVTFKALGNHQYIVYVGEYLNKYSLSQPEIQTTNARINLYASSYTQGPLLSLQIPFDKTQNSESTNKPYRYWTAFCIDGGLSLNKILVLNSLSNLRPTLATCQQAFLNNP